MDDISKMFDMWLAGIIILSLISLGGILLLIWAAAKIISPYFT